MSREGSVGLWRAVRTAGFSLQFPLLLSNVRANRFVQTPDERSEREKALAPTHRCVSTGADFNTEVVTWDG